MKRRRRFWYWLALALSSLSAILGIAAFVWREDIARTALDPREPYQTYDPPPAPDYTQAAAWALLPPRPEQPGHRDPPADVFFIHPTTYEGGSEWNAPVGERVSERVLRRVMLPNYAGPYQRLARVFAPRYRHASLYTSLTLRDDARDARRFAYQDVRAAFHVYRDRYNQGRPFLVVGVEQGGSLADRLIDEEIATDPALKARFAGAHIIGAVVAADAHEPDDPIPACRRRRQAGCLVAWASVTEGERERADRLIERALVWDDGRLDNLGDRPALCVNPLLGAASDAPAPASLHLGAANASNLEWGVVPPFLKQRVSARCVDGVLRVSRPDSETLRRGRSWIDRFRAPGYNLFYADVEADAQARLETLLNLRRDRSPPASRTAPPAR